jgi:hypothetical protein
VSVAAASGNVGVVVVVVAPRSWIPPDVDGLIDMFSEQARDTVATLATLQK